MENPSDDDSEYNEELSSCESDEAEFSDSYHSDSEIPSDEELSEIPSEDDLEEELKEEEEEEEEELSEPEVIETPLDLPNAQPRTPQYIPITSPNATTQTQSPPITPEHTRKRSYTDTEEILPMLPVTPPSDLPVPRKIAPMRAPSPPTFIGTAEYRAELEIKEAEPTATDFQIEFLKEKMDALTSRNEDLERATKRRRVENGRGWVGTVKTLGKYTVAGVIGGIATVVGLAWNAKERT